VRGLSPLDARMPGALAAALPSTRASGDFYVDGWLRDRGAVDLEIMEDVDKEYSKPYINGARSAVFWKKAVTR